MAFAREVADRVVFLDDGVAVQEGSARAAAWMRPVDHHGYFMPSEGASDGALAWFSFPGMAAYEQYRQRFDVDPAPVAADCIRDESGCVLRYARSVMRPFLGVEK